MKLSTQEEYGLRCLLRVGKTVQSGSCGSVTIPELSRAEGISEPNVAKMMRILRQGGFVTATRGHSGGYTLSRPAEEIAVGHVLAVLGGRIFDSNFCVAHAGTANLCGRTSDCSIRLVWQTIQSAIDGVLATLSLRDLLGSERDMSAWATGRTLPTLEHRAP